MPPTYPREVAVALETGKLWRAKEILSGRISSAPFSPALYEQYGALLLRSGDLFQAGRYLFLSGARDADYDEAIALFVSRVGHGGLPSVIGTFPARVRRLEMAALPAAAQTTLRSLEPAPASRPSRRRRKAERGEASLGKRAASAMAKIGCVALLLFFAFALAAGAPVVLDQIAGWFD